MILRHLKLIEGVSHRVHDDDFEIYWRKTPIEMEFSDSEDGGYPISPKDLLGFNLCEPGNYQLYYFIIDEEKTEKPIMRMIKYETGFYHNYIFQIKHNDIFLTVDQLVVSINKSIMRSYSFSLN